MVEKILSTDFVNRNEIEVFENCIDWAKRQCEIAEKDSESPGILRAQLGDCFNLIRFDTMTSAQFLECLSIDSVVFTLDEIKAFSSHFTGTKVYREALELQYDDSKVDIHNEKVIETDYSFLKSMFQDHTTADITFVFKNANNEVTERFSAHKCILAQRSEIFTDLFKNSPESSQEIQIGGVSAVAFKDFLQLIYLFDWIQRDYIMENIPHQSVDAILSLAKEYKTFDIIGWYDVNLWLNLDDKNVMWCFDLAHKDSMDMSIGYVLKSKCVEFLQENGEKAMVSGAFLDIEQQTLKA